MIGWVHGWFFARNFEIINTPVLRRKFLEQDKELRQYNFTTMLFTRPLFWYNYRYKKPPTPQTYLLKKETPTTKTDIRVFLPAGFFNGETSII